MATSREYLNFILDQLSGLDGVTHRAMMGEYILYYRGKIVGDICDNRLLVKPTPSARRLMPKAKFELPYEGSKQLLLLADCVDSRERMEELFEAMYDELPERKKR